MKTLALAGFSMQVPDEWDLAAIKMDREETLLSIQDLKSVRLEIRWQDVGWKKAKEESRKTGKQLTKKLLDPDEAIEVFHKKLKKNNKALDFEGETEKIKVDGHTGVASSWTDGSHEGYDVMWYCGVTDRYYYLTYMKTDPDESFEAFSKLLSGINCHAIFENVKWQYLGLNLSIPRGMSLLDQRAEVGKITLFFRGYWPLPSSRRRVMSFLRPPPMPQSRALIISRWNLLRLKDNDIAAWSIKEATSLIKRYIGNPHAMEKPEKAMVNGHDALRMIYSVKMGLLRPRRRYFSIYAWECPPSSSAYLLVNELPEKASAAGLGSAPEPPPYVSCHGSQDLNGSEEPDSNAEEARRRPRGRRGDGEMLTSPSPASRPL
ncbi:hypothetical protein PQ610_00795 [Tardisphaera miroshnichenkoae]